MKNITKDKVTQIIRHVVQLISFIIYPGLFALCFNSIGVIYQLIITGTASIATLLSPILILAAIIPISIIWGRFFCSYICSFGAMQELFNWLGDILHIKKIQVPKAVDKYLKYLKYVVIAIFFLVWTLQVNIDSYLPWSAFGILTSWNGFSGVLSIGGIMLLLIVIGSLFLDRFFCKYLCPLGGVFRLVTKPRLFKIRKAEGCVNCNSCNKNCPMNVDISATDSRVKDSECIDCFKCVKSCEPRVLCTPTNQAVNGTVASLSILGLSLVGNVALDSYENVTSSNANVVAVSEANPTSEKSSNDTSSSKNESTSSSTSTGQYKDGTYTGTGSGFRGNTKVTVTVKNGEISSITVDSYEDDSQYFNKAKTSVINSIISSQGIDVSTVSGATFSSNSIIEAVANAPDLQFTNNNEQLASSGKGHKKR